MSIGRENGQKNYCLFCQIDGGQRFVGFVSPTKDAISDMESEIFQDPWQRAFDTLENITLTRITPGQNYLDARGQDYAWSATGDASREEFSGYLLLNKKVVTIVAECVANPLDTDVFSEFPHLISAVRAMKTPIAYVSNLHSFQNIIRHIAMSNIQVAELFKLRGSGEDTPQTYADYPDGMRG